MSNDKLILTSVRIPKKDLLAFRKKYKGQFGKQTKVIRDAIKKAIKQ